MFDADGPKSLVCHSCGIGSEGPVKCCEDDEGGNGCERPENDRRGSNEGAKLGPPGTGPAPDPSIPDFLDGVSRDQWGDRCARSCNHLAVIVAGISLGL